MRGNLWASKDELINDVLLGTPTHGHTSIGQPTKTYICFVRTLDTAERT